MSCFIKWFHCRLYKTNKNVKFDNGVPGNLVRVRVPPKQFLNSPNETFIIGVISSSLLPLSVNTFIFISLHHLFFYKPTLFSERSTHVGTQQGAAPAAPPSTAANLRFADQILRWSLEFLITNTSLVRHQNNYKNQCHNTRFTMLFKKELHSCWILW